MPVRSPELTVCIFILCLCTWRNVNLCIVEMRFSVSEWNKQAVKNKSETSPVILRGLLVLPLSFIFLEGKNGIAFGCKVLCLCHDRSCWSSRSVLFYWAFTMVLLLRRLGAVASPSNQTGMDLFFHCPEFAERISKQLPLMGLKSCCLTAFLVHSFVSCDMLPLLCDEFSLSPCTQWEFLPWNMLLPPNNVGCSPLDRACQSHSQRRAASKSIKAFCLFLGMNCISMWIQYNARTQPWSQEFRRKCFPPGFS